MISIQLINFLVEQEGFRAEWYKDIAGVDTIGYGHTRKPGDGELSPLTPLQARNLLYLDVLAIQERAAGDFSRIIGYPITRLPERHQDALTALAYNTGSILTHPLFVDALAKGRIDVAIEESKVAYRDVKGNLVWLARRNGAFIRTFLIAQGSSRAWGLEVGAVAGWPIWLATWRMKRMESKDGG